MFPIAPDLNRKKELQMKPYVPSCEEEARYLAAYDPGKYKNPAVTADVALFGREDDALFLLLIRRGGYPYKGYFALPGGFVDIAESVPAGAARELLEETGLAGLKLHECGVLSEPERDPRQRVISVVYRLHRFTLSGSEVLHIALREYWQDGVLQYESLGDDLANDHAQACLWAYLGYLRENGQAETPEL